MKVYKIQFVTDVFVEAENQSDAIALGKQYVTEEIKNGMYRIYVEPIDRITQVVLQDQHTFPWRALERSNEPQMTLAQILNASQVDASQPEQDSVVVSDPQDAP